VRKIGQYTARGQYTEALSESDGGKRINVFDGDYSTGYRITNFYVWSGNYASSSNADVIGKVGTVGDLSADSSDFMNANDVREIAWAASAGATDAGLGFAEGPIIDRENMNIEEVYVYVRSAGTAIPVNYLIEFDVFDLEPYQGSLAIVRNSAQG
jgi:hypothetical protein